MNLIALKDLAIMAALSAGELILQSMDSDVMVETKSTGQNYASQVVTAVDRACEEEIFSYLLPSCKEHGIALLSEETADDGSRFQKNYFWCIDPMDGTLAFIQKRPGFSVSIALVAKDGTPHIGVVYDPSTHSLYHAIKGHGVFKNGIPWVLSGGNEHLTYMTDKKLIDTPRAADINIILNEKVAQLSLSGVKEIAGAGAVLNAIHVLENGPACMLKFPKQEEGGGSLWDYAATACMFHELGLPATNFNGNKLDLNKKKGTFMNHEGVMYTNFNV